MFFETHKNKDPAESSKIVNKRSTYFFIGLSLFDVLENFICRRINYKYFVASVLFDFNAITWLMSHHLKAGQCHIGKKMFCVLRFVVIQCSDGNSMS